MLPWRLMLIAGAGSGNNTSAPLDRLYSYFWRLFNPGA